MQSGRRRPGPCRVWVSGDLTCRSILSAKLIVAEDLVDELAAKFDTPLTVIGLLKEKREDYARPVPNDAIRTRR